MHQCKAEEGGDAVALLTDDNIRTVPVLCNDANSECLVYEELINGVLVLHPVRN